MADDEGLRKLSAILAADVAGYSRLMADDERATVRTLTEYREVFSDLVGRHKGRIVDTAGDSVLAIFDSVVEAVEAAVEVQRELKERNEALADHRRMWFRIGVNLGDIIVRADGTVYGDGVNVAARLEALAEPGVVMISDFARQGIGSRIRVSFEDAGAHTVKNILEAVRAYRVLTEGDQSARLEQSQKFGVPGLRIAATLALLVLASGAAWWFGISDEMPEMVTAEGISTDDPVLALPTGPSIAVLPFDNMTGSSEQEFFVDGITENIISGLAQFGNLFVVARNSTFQFKGTAVDVRDVANRLGVRFVLEGSVQRSNNQLRITTQLIDGENGSHLWAETYDRELNAENIFAIQDEITGHVASTLAGESGVITRHSNLALEARRTDDLDAYECVLRSLDFFNVNFTPENHLTVTACLEKAVIAAPNYVDAWAHLAMVHFFAGHAAKLNPGSDYLERGMAAARRALELDTTSQLAHRAMSVAHYFHGELEQFKAEAEEAIALNPHHADALAEVAQNLAFTGDWERGAALTRKAMALNPMHPDWWWFTMAKYHLVKGELDQAVAAAQKINLEDYWVTHVTRAYIYAHAGRLSDARRAVDKFVELRPEASIETAIKFYELWQFEPRYIESYVAAGLRLAGLAETPTSPTRPVIAVLPFENLSGDLEQDYFSDGLSRDLITELSRINDFDVVASQVTFEFRDKTRSGIDVGREIGSHYLIEGSVRRTDDQIRINAELSDMSDGSLLWSERYDREFSDVFAIQDEITAKIIASIAGGFGAVERARIETVSAHAPSNVAAYDLLLHAHGALYAYSKDGYLAGKNFINQAIALDPDYGRARRDLAWWMLLGWIFRWEEDLNPPDEIKEQAIRAVELDPSDGVAHRIAAFAYFFDKQMDRFETEVDLALQLAPYDAETIVALGFLVEISGQWERGTALIERAHELNPYATGGWYHSGMFYKHFRLGEYEEALNFVRQGPSQELSENFVKYVSVYGQLGEIEKGLEFWRKFEAQENGMSPTDGALHIWRLWNFPEDEMKHLMEGIRIIENAANAS